MANHSSKKIENFCVLFEKEKKKKKKKKKRKKQNEKNITLFFLKKGNYKTFSVVFFISGVGNQCGFQSFWFFHEHCSFVIHLTEMSAALLEKER